MKKFGRSSIYWIALATVLLVTSALYWPGLHGGYLFDDYPNIVDNSGVQPPSFGLASIVRAALSSPASEFKRPLASLSFAMNYLATGLDPYWMKFTNLVIHLLNGLLIFLLARSLLAYERPVPDKTWLHLVAILITTGWLLLPINLTAVLYVVQRMESLANIFVLLGMLGYLSGRTRMLAALSNNRTYWAGFLLCVVSLTVPTAIGSLAKETAALLPLYSFLIECTLFGFGRYSSSMKAAAARPGNRDRKVITLFLLVLFIPFVVGICWLLPNILEPGTWTARGFTLSERLLSEARIVVSYIAWTVLPLPNELSFYHDNFSVSTGLLTPVSTLLSVLVISWLLILTAWLRSRRPLITLGILLFFGCQLMTATILPLELIYEHRNYFASFGLVLAIIPLLVPRNSTDGVQSRLPIARWTLLVGLLLLWSSETAMSAIAWGEPLKLAESLAARAPDSPRAQYELGRTYIIYSHYDPNSPFTKLAYAPLERAAALPGSSILPEQALIFMNARMHLPLDEAWWRSMITKLKLRKPTIQDESSLAALTQCDRDKDCDLPMGEMEQAYLAALSHSDPSARLLAMYGDFAWNVMNDHPLGLQMAEETVKRDPSEPVYRITLIRMLVASGQHGEALKQTEDLKRLNIGGRLDADLRALPH